MESIRKGDAKIMNEIISKTCTFGTKLVIQSWSDGSLARDQSKWEYGDGARGLTVRGRVNFLKIVN